MSEMVNRRNLLATGVALGGAAVAGAAWSGTAAADGRYGRPMIGPAYGDKLHVMTFNIRYDNDPPPHSWPERLPLISALLRREQPTLLGTQEGLYHQLRDLRGELPHHDWIHLFRSGGSKGEAMAVFFDTRRLEPVAYDHLWLSDTPLLIGSKSWGNNVVRMLTWVRFRDRRTGGEFILLNTHFDHQSEQSRQHSAVMVRDVVAEFDVPVIVSGDFNTGPESVPYQTLMDGGLSDTWQTAAKRLTPEWGTFNFWDAEPSEGGRIDWLLTGPDVAVHATGVNTWSKRGLVPSDHWPVQALVTVG